MPLTDRSQAKKGGFQQVREALRKFEGTVASAEFGQWGGKLVDDDGKPVRPKEFMEVSCTEVEVLEVTEELTMPIDEWNFRVNTSDFEGSFWVDKFLESADRFKIQIPEGLVGKRVVWEKVDMTFSRKDGTEITSSNFVIAGVKSVPKPAPKVIAKGTVAPKATVTPAPVEVAPEAVETAEEEPVDLLELSAQIAVGKTEAQFRSAVATNAKFAGTPFLAMAKAGAITQALVNEGKLELVKDGAKEIYKKVE